MNRRLRRPVSAQGSARAACAGDTRHLAPRARAWATSLETATQGRTRAHVADVYVRIPGALRHVAQVPRIRLARSAQHEGCVSPNQCAQELEVRR